MYELLSTLILVLHYLMFGRLCVTEMGSHGQRDIGKLILRCLGTFGPSVCLGPFAAGEAAQPLREKR